MKKARAKRERTVVDIEHELSRLMAAEAEKRERLQREEIELAKRTLLVRNMANRMHDDDELKSTQEALSQARSAESALHRSKKMGLYAKLLLDKKFSSLGFSDTIELSSDDEEGEEVKLVRNKLSQHQLESMDREDIISSLKAWLDLSSDTWDTTVVSVSRMRITDYPNAPVVLTCVVAKQAGSILELVQKARRKQHRCEIPSTVKFVQYMTKSQVAEQKTKSSPQICSIVNRKDTSLLVAHLPFHTKVRFKSCRVL